LWGAEVLLEEWEIEIIPMLFGEDQGRVVLSYLPANHDNIAELCDKHGVPLTPIGEVMGNCLNIQTRKNSINIPVEELRTIWRSSLFKLMGWEMPPI
jgi:phosphoribosylformylglycinamidine (FGAM) synthase-like enzyme